MLEGGPQAVLRVEVDGAPQGLEEPLGRVLGVANDLSGDEPTLLVERSLIEVGFEQLDEGRVSVFIVGGRGSVSDAAAAVGGRGSVVAVGIGVFVFGVGVLLDGPRFSGRLLVFDLLGAHEG